MSVAASIRNLLAEVGPLTSREVATQLGVSHRIVANALCNMRRARVQTAHVHSWTRDGIGRTYPRPLWTVGQGKDARKPKPPCNRERCRLYRMARKQRVASVFDLGRRV